MYSAHRIRILTDSILTSIPWCKIPAVALNPVPLNTGKKRKP